MAESKVVITTEVKTGDSLNSLKNLKKELKEAQAAALNGDGKAAKRVAELKDRMDDLTDATKTFQGSGVERATSSLNLLGDGFKNLDLDKVKTGFKGLGAAMAAVPIFLIVEGITYLIQNFEELSQGNGILAKSLRAVGDVIDWVVDKVYALTDALGLTNSELDKQGEAIKENADKTKEALDQQTAAFDRQIKAAQAAGKSTVELEKAKQQAIIDTNLQVVKQIEAFVRAGGELDDEKKRLLTASLEAIKTAKNDQNVIEIKAETDKNKAIEEEAKRHQEELLKIRKDAQAQINAGEEAERANLLEFNQMLAAEQKAIDDKALADQMAQDDADFATYQKRQKDVADFDEAQRKKKEEDEKASNQAIQDAKAKGLQAGQALSEAFFAIQLNRAKGNAARELEIRKQMFNVDKAFNVARATQDGIRSVQAALTIPPPGGQILAGVNAALAIANVGRILNTKFDGGGASISAETGSVSVPTNTSLPTVSNTTAPNIQPSTSFDETGRNLNNRVYVLESDITKSQGRVARLNEQATI
jgi:hypothetical protein